MPRVVHSSLVAGLLSLFVLVGCSGSAAVHAAQLGSHAELRRILQDELQREALNAGAARSIAHAVASFEIAHATPPLGAERLRELRACARHLEDALAERAAGADTIAAAAGAILLEAGLADAESIREHAARLAGSGAPAVAAAFRALHTRALVSATDGSLRRKRMLDGDQEVRAAALRAAIVAVDPSDRDVLLESARLDPHPLSRTLAIRAAGALGGEVIVLVLKDIWALADEPSREGIVDAWASAHSLDAGGRRQLLWAMTQRGAPAIAAARALARAGGAGSGDAISALVQAIRVGPSRDRVYAVLSAPISDQAVRAALAVAQRDVDDAVAFAAFIRFAEAPPGAVSPNDRAAAVSWLRKVAAGASSRAVLAQSALARAGVRDVASLLVRAIEANDEHTRAVAGMALVELGELPRAAMLLADPSPRVRTSIACAVLREP